MKLFKLLIAVFAGLLISGCGKYSAQSLYDTDIKTVSIDMFESDSFRRGVEFELTQALVDRIGVDTPYKICQDKKESDSLLYGRILSVNERVLNYQRELDRPMQEQLVVVAEVTWKDLRSGKLLLDRQKFRFTGNYSALQNDSLEVAAREAVNKMAADIVEAMESGW